MTRNKIAKGIIIVGALLLVITAFLHLYLGLPPIIDAINNGQITRAPAMAPSELLSIWIAFSIILLFMISGMLLHLRKERIDKLNVSFTGLASVAAAITMLIHNPGVHISVPLLALPGILIIIGAVIFKSDQNMQ